MSMEKASDMNRFRNMFSNGTKCYNILAKNDLINYI